jgi:hypothetical protein
VEPLRVRYVVFLDYTTNGDVTDLCGPLSHAALIRLYVEDRRLREDDLTGSGGRGQR